MRSLFVQYKLVEVSVIFPKVQYKSSLDMIIELDLQLSGLTTGTPYFLYSLQLMILDLYTGCPKKSHPMFDEIERK